MRLSRLIFFLLIACYLSACVDQQNQANSQNTQQRSAETSQPTQHTNDTGSTRDTILPRPPKGAIQEILINDTAQSAAQDAVPESRKESKGPHRLMSQLPPRQSREKSRRLSSYESAIVKMPMIAEPTDRENYQHFDENTVKEVTQSPVSTFSIDVDTAAYSNIRRMLSKDGRLPPKDAVKLEEMINYFNYNYPTANSLEQPFSVTTEVAPAPWNPKTQLLQIGLKGYEPAREKRPDANLVFLVDVSGSMKSQDKLGLVKKSLRLLVNQMQQRDRIALVVYAGAAGLVLNSTTADQKATILAAIDSLESGGSTNGGAGIRLAYNVAQQHFIKDGINRIIIASDGDMNVGTVSIHALKNLIEEKRKSGIALTTLGFGSGNYNYALMEQLADVGNGNAAYIDNLREAQKVLVEQMQSTLVTIAKDVKIQVEFNPSVVAQYRLIGYENRLLNREDFKNDKVDAGEIGAGHTVTALYELTLVGSQATMIPPRRYGDNTQKTKNNKQSSHQHELAYVKLRYKKPQANQSQEVSTPILVNQMKKSLDSASQDYRFAAGVAGFGQLLRGGKYTQNWRYDDALQLLRTAKGEDPHGYRGELVSLVELAKSLSMQGS